jgi:mono/diheme cytochrome c family protein
MLGPRTLRFGLGLGVPLAFACGRPPVSDRTEGRATFDPGPIPPELAGGAELFLRACQGCHGPGGSGFSGGPPLVDSLYLAPGFPDSAIAAAIRSGVRRHPWALDDMPPARTVRADQVPAIVDYVRWLQARWSASRASP